MKPVLAFLSFFAMMWASNQPALAQSRDIGDIFGDIFKDKRGGQNQGQYPYQSMVDNIPVTVRFDAGPNGLPENASLILSAFAPPAPNVRRSSPLLIGQTRILLNGLYAPLELVIAAPSNVTSDIDYARIEAKIVDRHGSPLYELRNSGEYRGAETPILYLDRIGSPPQSPDIPPHNPTQNRVHGSVEIGSDSSQFRGSNLFVRLLEDGLAGGKGQLIVGKTQLSLDGKNAPFNFSFTPSFQSDDLTPLVIEAWIEDWAGRKTYTMSQPMQYNGPDISYRLPLQATRTNTLPPATPSYKREIKGEAQFNAHKGLPKGSVLIAELEQNHAGTRPTNIAKTTIKLDGLSGNIAFTLDTMNRQINQREKAVLRVRIEDKNGKLFFSNPGGTPLKRGFNPVELQASPNY